ncbi:hypothetical protein [Mycolicibacterium sp.]|jgi:hypothetical protein|uniref:hypothetical protein n=1 Tax=Mycolicibacterium sp. TaxID=2320850 RepID=UPI0037C5A2CC
MTSKIGRFGIGAAVVASLVGGPVALAVMVSSGTASADVCASAGRRVTVSGCASLSDVMAPYVVPQDAYAPITPNASACVGWNGRWVNASGCT